MQLIQVTLLALLSTIVAADDIDNNDIPTQCSALCAPVVTLSNTCDRQTDNVDDDNDRAYLACFCQAANANVALPACEACVSNFDTDRSDNDVNDLLRSCSFAATSYVSGTAVPTIGSASGVVAATTTNSAGSTVVVATPGASTISTRTTAPGGSVAGQTTAPTSTPNAGEGLKVERGVGGVVLLGALGAWGLI